MASNNSKSAVPTGTGRNSKTAPQENKPATIPPPEVIPPLFRRIDWITFGITALFVFIGYCLTMAPDVTLEDSGELAVGSFYAGVPHPPGYPLWTIYTWLFTVLLPISNIAFRVSVASAVSGALATGLLALITSRGSSMMIESIEAFKDIPRKAEGAICMVSGFVAGLLLAFNGYMWSQCVIVEVYPFSVLSLMGVIACLLRWVYAPSQRRYLYWAWFLFGVCFTNHQTLIVAAMGLEVAILVVQPKLGRDLLLGNSVAYLTGAIVLGTHMMGSFEPNPMVQTIFHIVGVVSILGCGILTFQTGSIGTNILPALAMFGLWIVGFGIYFFMPLSSMTNPPMNWGYARTLDGFIHALTRGQYEKTNPTDFLSGDGFMKLVGQAWMYLAGAKDEFNLVNLLIALVPFLFFFKMQKRERSWLIGLVSIWACLAVLLMILLNPTPDLQSRQLIRVFFTSSYSIISILIGYGLTLSGAFMVTNYQKFRLWGIVGGAVAVLAATYTLWATTQTIFGNAHGKSGFELFFGAISHSFDKDQYGLPVYAGMILVGLTLGYLLLNLVCRSKPPTYAALGLVAFLPIHAIMSQWSDNEQRGHLFGYWFGHDMFTPPYEVYPEMAKNAILFGGTDPGRFCPTYMIFCESFIPPSKKPRDPKFDRRDVYLITQNALADPPYLEYIRAHYFRSAQIDPPFFQELLRTSKEKGDAYKTNILASLAYNVLDRPFLSLGAKVEDKRRKEGIYPLKEIYTPSMEDHGRCFSEYMADAQMRLQHDQKFPLNQYPNEPRQIKPGEEIIQRDGRITINGQVAVMSINALLAKVIFEKNPTNEFYVEESFPLDWMYPYLSPFGVIMKINRQPLSELSETATKQDHEFWSKYSDRLVGNWVTYDTSVQEVVSFIEKVYLQRNFSGFKGDRKFIRDDSAQKAFSKLRSSIGGVYAWRVMNAKSGEEQQRMLKEADFAFKQAFSFCPFSPEAVGRYAQLLANPLLGRIDDAILVTRTFLKFDQFNGGMMNLLRQLEDYKARSSKANVSLPEAISRLEAEVKAQPSNYQSIFNLATAYFQAQQNGRAEALLDGLVAAPQIDFKVVSTVASIYAQRGAFPKLEATVLRLTQLDPNSVGAWYDLAALRAQLGKPRESLENLKQALQLANRVPNQNPTAAELMERARTDARFNAIRSQPEFKELVPPK